MELTDEQKKSLKDKYGSFITAETPNESAILAFKKPTKPVWTAYQEGLAKETMSRSASFLSLALDCLVHPTLEEADKIFTEFPGMPTRIAGELSKMAGLSDELNIKKY